MDFRIYTLFSTIRLFYNTLFKLTSIPKNINERDPTMEELPTKYLTKVNRKEITSNTTKPTMRIIVTISEG